MSFITTDTQTGWKTYQRTCRMVMIKAFEDVFGRENAPKVFVMYSIGKALYCELDTEEEPTEELIAQVRQKMIEIVEDIVQYALDAMGSAVDVGDRIAIQGGTDHAVRTGVDDSGGPAGLSDQAGANEFIHYCSPLVFASMLNILL